MTDPFAPARASRRLLIFVFFAALLPRLWALSWAMPLKKAHIDEAVVVFYSLRVVAGDPNPRVFFDYPALFLYVLAALFKVALFLARLVGQSVPPNAEVLTAYSRGDGLLFLLGAARLLSAVLGAAVAAAIAQIGAARWGLFSGAAAALLWAVNPLAVRTAHYATVDMLAVLLFFIAVDRLASYWEAGDAREGYWTAFVIGLAAAAKYYPGALLLILLAAALRRGRWRQALGMTALSAGAFVLASPFTALEFRAFAGRFAHLAPKIAGVGGAFLWPTLKHLGTQMGAVTLLSAAAGLLILVRSSAAGDRVWAWTAAGFLLFFGTWTIQSAHYALPLYPIFFLACAVFLRSLGSRSRFLPVGGLVVLLALSLPPTAAVLRRLSTPDTRNTALAWARESFPPASRVLRFAHTPEFAPRDPFQVTVDWENERLAKGAAALDARDFDYLIYSTYGAQDEVARELSARFTLLRAFDSPSPDFPHHPVVLIYRVSQNPPVPGAGRE